jgi:hypothetical protein
MTRWKMNGRKNALIVALTVLVLAAATARSDGLKDAGLDQQQQEAFLLHAKVIRSRRTDKGTTNPYRLTLTDGKITHDASFQPVFERDFYKKFSDGTAEANYVDSYLYNIAAYRLAGLLGLEAMMPATVERKWNDMIGSLSWWLSVQMDEGERIRKGIQPPDIAAYNRQMDKVRVFVELVYDTDRNSGNTLIGRNWEIYMIDFTRAFRLYRDLRNAGSLKRCSRDLLLRLKQLDRDALAKKTKGFLTGDEVNAVMARRDKIVAYFEHLIAEKGEESILY